MREGLSESKSYLQVRRGSAGFIVGCLVILCIVFSSCSANIGSGGPSTGNSTSSTGNTSGTPSSSGQTGAEPNWGVQTKTSGCTVQGTSQDFACTPGALLATGTKEAICQPGYSSSVRNVPTSVKNQVYAEYGIASHSAGEYEVDHLVSLELGGSNDISNLWPEAASPAPGFHEKDKVENYLHSQVCSGTISLKDAQIKIATNWLAVYNQMPSK